MLTIGCPMITLCPHQIWCSSVRYTPVFFVKPFTTWLFYLGRTYHLLMSTCCPFRSLKILWVPASAGKATAGMVHSVSVCTRDVQIKLRSRVPYLNALEVWSRQGTLQIHVYLNLYLKTTTYLLCSASRRRLLAFWYTRTQKFKNTFMVHSLRHYQQYS